MLEPRTGAGAQAELHWKEQTGLQEQVFKCWLVLLDQFDKQSGEEWMKVLLMSEVRTGVQAGVTDYTEI